MIYSDNNLGNDNVEMLNRWKREKNGEYAEIHTNNQMNQSKGQAFPKLKMWKETIKKNAKQIAIASMLAIGVIGASYHHSAGVIADHVYNSGILEGISDRNDSITGHVITHTDAYGNTETLNYETAIKMIVEKGIEKGYDKNEMAIALDRMHLCDARDVDGSSLIGRVAKETSVLTGMWNIDEQIQEAIGETESQSSGRSI